MYSEILLNIVQNSKETMLPSLTGTVNRTFKIKWLTLMKTHDVLTKVSIISVKAHLVNLVLTPMRPYHWCFTVAFPPETHLAVTHPWYESMFISW